jgi:hypothetical protein
MRRRRRSTIEDLRAAIDCLPAGTRRAMLEGIRQADIIVGAYTDGEGGVCPMLAAHRHGGRTDCISFAHAWDRFTVAKRARRATRREVRILERHLEESLAAEQDACDLSAAIAEHQDLARRRRAAEASRSRPQPGDPDRSRELRRRGGWAWLPPVRRLDDYERALALVQEQLEAASPDRELILS